jgi:hypothetical protein
MTRRFVLAALGAGSIPVLIEIGHFILHLLGVAHPGR